MHVLVPTLSLTVPAFSFHDEHADSILTIPIYHGELRSNLRVFALSLNVSST